MSYEIQFSEPAVKDLQRLPRAVQARIVNKLRDAASDPVRFFRRLTGRPIHRLRVGGYRVLAEISTRERMIRVTHIGHRKDIYD